MGAYDYFAPGDWNARCEECYAKRKASGLRKRWDGAMVCEKCWEPRNPQDFVKGVPDKQNVPWSRPDSPPIWVIPPLDPYLQLMAGNFMAETFMG